MNVDAVFADSDWRFDPTIVQERPPANVSGFSIYGDRASIGRRRVQDTAFDRYGSEGHRHVLVFARFQTRLPKLRSIRSPIGDDSVPERTEDVLSRQCWRPLPTWLLPNDFTIARVHQSERSSAGYEHLLSRDDWARPPGREPFRPLLVRSSRRPPIRRPAGVRRVVLEHRHAIGDSERFTYRVLLRGGRALRLRRFSRAGLYGSGVRRGRRIGVRRFVLNGLATPSQSDGRETDPGEVPSSRWRI